MSQLSPTRSMAMPTISYGRSSNARGSARLKRRSPGNDKNNRSAIKMLDHAGGKQRR
jgi:hypothetical protein